MTAALARVGKPGGEGSPAIAREAFSGLGRKITRSPEFRSRSLSSTHLKQLTNESHCVSLRFWIGTSVKKFGHSTRSDPFLVKEVLPQVAQCLLGDFVGE